MSSIFLEPTQTRLVTIAAHVDHGKTTLADNLIEHNGIISERLAGTVRYLDSDPEEQRRGITMRSSAIGLSHQYKAPPSSKNKESAGGGEGPRIIHLVDSPGHTDFSLEVSSALTACDACLLVVDAVEGMGPRTHQVFRETLVNQLVPVLVINKMDRLCTNLGLTPTEAYLRIRSLLESVNAAASAMITSLHQQQQERLQQQQQEEITDNAGREASKTTTTDPQKPLEETKANDDENLWTFDPAKGNVVFCSALHGWGFTAASLTRSLFKHKVVPIKPILLRPYIFGDYKLRGDKVLKWKASSSSETTDVPLFAEYGLQPLWDLYQGVATAAQSVGQTTSLVTESNSFDNNNQHAHQQEQQQQYKQQQVNGNTKINSSNYSKIKADTLGMEQVLDALQVGATGEHVVSTVDEMNVILTRTGASTEESVLRCLLRRYRPLASTVLDVVCDYCPSPRQSSQSVRSQLLSLRAPLTEETNDDEDDKEHNDSQFDKIQQAVHECDTSPNAPCVAHVCKFFSTSRANLRDASLSDSSSNGDKENLILGLTRVLSGKLRTGNSYYLFGPKYKKKKKDDDDTLPLPQKSIRLYLLMGSSFVLVEEVPAGHLCAVLNLEDVQLKNITLSDRRDAMPLATIERRMRPLVKVSLEAENSDDAHELDKGLLKLSLADAAVEVTATARGERILACLGEIHLEQSLLDLQNIYFTRRDIRIRTSDPIVDFGETTDWFPNELSLDYKAFCNMDPKSPPQPRQATIPPYNEEEGLSGAHHGRARSLVSGRSAALSLRVIPLADSVHKALQQQTLDDEEEEGSSCREELVKIGKALGLLLEETVSDKEAPSKILEILRDCLCCLATNGNALMESPNLKNGIAVFGVESDKGEVYTHHTTTESSSTTPGSDDHVHENVQSSEVEQQQQPSSGRGEYEALQLCIRDGTKANHSFCRNGMLDEAAMAAWNKLRGSAVTGFQMALRSGPICDEPVRNILVVLEGFEIAMSPVLDKDDAATGTGSAGLAALAAPQPAKSVSGGMMVSALRSGIRCALLTRPARLMEGYLRLTLNSSLNGLGSLYSVLSKRRGKVEDDSMVDGTNLLAITALIPQAEAFGLAPELYAKTSGEVTAPEMIFSHWQRLDVDPFWIPTTEEEREDFGELLVAGDSSTGMDNTAVRYIRKVRERKGLKMDASRTVLAAEKQRTLKR